MRVQSVYDLQSPQKFVESNLLTKMRCSLSVNGLRRFFIYAISSGLRNRHSRLLYPYTSPITLSCLTGEI